MEGLKLFLMPVVQNKKEHNEDCSKGRDSFYCAKSPDSSAASCQLTIHMRVSAGETQRRHGDFWHARRLKNRGSELHK